MQTISFSGCSPKPPKLPKSDSHEQLTAALGAALNLEGTSHDQSNPAFQFAATLKDILTKNYQIYNEINGYVNSFISHDGDWSPIELNIIKMKMTFDISDSEELTTLKNQFNTYKPKLVELLDKIKPAHEQMQKLAEAVKLISSSAETKIDPKLSQELQKEANKVIDIFQEFENVMKHFQLKLFIQKLDDVRAAIVKLKNQEMYFDDAKEFFTQNVNGSMELVAPNLEILNAAMKIHYADLAKANKRIQDIVEKLIKHVKK